MVAHGRARAAVAVALGCGAAALVRWRLADLADWGIDEAANLWLGTTILRGDGPRLGLVSSVGTPNLAGAPLLAAPLALLPDLLAVSRALALAQLVTLAALALAIARGRRGRVIAVAALAFCPAPLLAAPSLWNQYLALPITAAITALLLALVERPPAGRVAGVAAATLLVALLLLQPALHLAGFADLVAQGALALALLGLASPRARPAGLELALAIGLSAALVLYQPWLVRVFALTPRAALLAYGAVAVMAVLAAGGVVGRLSAWAQRGGEARPLAWCVPAVLVVCAGSAAQALRGAQIAVRLVEGDGWGVALLAAQLAIAALAVPALPGMVADCRAGAAPGALLRRWFPGRERAAALLLVNAALLVVARAVLVPSAFMPNGRADMLLPLLPALLAPALLLVVATPRPALRAWAAVVAGGVAALVVAFALLGPSPRFWQRHPLFLPPSEMRELVDWIAAQPGAVGADGRLDVGYDLEQGREHFLRAACSPATSWYTVSRPFDWLFLRRHGLRDRREGSCARRGGGRWVVTYRAAAAPVGRQRRLELGHLVVWE